MGKRKKNKALVKQEVEPLRKGLTTEWYYLLKYIAIITMLIEHTVFIIGARSEVLLVGKMIGRVAFPLFAYLLVESFYFTKKRGKKALSLFILAIISELPFDFATSVLTPDNISTDAFLVQNVIFTLLLGFLMLWVKEFKWDKIFERAGFKKPNRFFNFGFSVAVGGVFAFLAYLLRTDYSWRGICLISFFDLARRVKRRNLLQAFSLLYFVTTASNYLLSSKVAYINTTSFIALILIYFAQSGKINFKERKVLVNKFTKTFGKWFYPLHLFILSIIKLIIS